jgi:hypothetical protein
MSESTTEATSQPATPTSSSFCYFFAHIGLWVGLFVALGSIIDKSSGALAIAVSAMSSSLLLFAIAAHLRQQALTNHLLEKIANKT